MGRKKYYMVLDTETATMPFANQIAKNSEEKKRIAIAKPLVYDIAWQIVDSKGKVYSRHSYLVSETFSVPAIFNTAYYHEKRPVYLERLNNGEITIKTWKEITDLMIKDLEKVDFVGAFNSMFDFKKAIIFTEKYINQLYSPDYYEWEKYQYKRCQEIAKKAPYENPNKFDPMNFDFRGKQYPLFDLWGISCQKLINTQKYKRQCLQHNMISESGRYFKSSAETTFRYLVQQMNFEELHMAIDDVEIECSILVKALKKGKIPKGIIFFPFKELGNVSKFIVDSRQTIPTNDIEKVVDKIEDKIESYTNRNSYITQLENDIIRISEFLRNKYNDTKYLQREKEIKIYRQQKIVDIAKDKVENSKRPETIEKWYQILKIEEEKLEEIKGM